MSRGAPSYTMTRVPRRRLQEEIRRLHSLLRVKRRLSRNFAELRGESFYWRPMPGCPGATVDAACMTQPRPSRMRASRRGLLVAGQVFGIRAALLRGRGYICAPGR